MASPHTVRFPIIAWLERRTRRQVVAAGIVLALVGLAVVLRAMAGVQLDRWWYAQTTTADVWGTQFAAKTLLTVAAVGFAALVVGSAVWLVLRTGDRIFGEPSRAMRWYHTRMGPAHRWLLIGIAALVGWNIARAAGQVWPQWLLYHHGARLGVAVPGTGGDLGDYLFDLPFEMTVSSFVRQLLALAAVIALFGHTMSGALRWSKRNVSRRLATVHLAVLLLALVVAQVADYLLVRPRTLALNRSGGFVGAGYVELNVVRPALVVSAIVAALAAVALVRSIFTRQWRLPAAAVAGWLAVHLITLVVAPTVVDRLLVRPAVGARQLPALARNLAATRAAYGLDQVKIEPTTLADGLQASPSASALAAVTSAPLFEANRMAGAFQALQGLPGTRVTDVDVDRYEIGGTAVPVLVGARQPDLGGLPEQGWVQQRMVYTHGRGLVVAPADKVDADGRPDFDHPLSLPSYDENTYYGDGLDQWWVVVGTRRHQQGDASYSGTAGVSVGNFWRRLVASAALGDSKLFLTAELTDESQLLFRRGLSDRLNALAPFVSWDNDPYPVIAGGHVVWVIDGYSTSATYPYSQYYGASGLPAGSDVASTTLNYLRHSVRATVDASTGDTHLYLTGATGSDPVIDTWARIFPGLFEPASQLPTAVADHARYPADAFVVQTTLLGQYYVDQAEELFNGSRRLSISGAAATSLDDPPAAAAASVFAFEPGADGTLVWSQIRPLNPGSAASSNSSRDVLGALAVASNDDPQTLVLRTLTSASGRQLASPRVAQAAIMANADIARALNQLNLTGSKVQFGPMTPLVVDGGLVWTRSVIVTGTGAATVPVLQSVLVISNGTVTNGATAAAALTAATR